MEGEKLENLTVFKKNDFAILVGGNQKDEKFISIFNFKKNHFEDQKKKLEIIDVPLSFDNNYSNFIGF